MSTMQLEAMAETYNDVKQLIRYTVYRFARRYGIRDVDDLMGDANYAFIQAYQRYDQTQGPFAPHCSFIVWVKLVDKMKRRIQHDTRAPMLHGDTDLLPSRDNTNDVDNRDSYLHLLHMLSEDAQTVVRLLVEPPTSIGEDIMAEELVDRGAKWYNHKTTRAQYKSVLRKYLIGQLNWTAERVAESFQELKTVLSS